MPLHPDLLAHLEALAHFVDQYDRAHARPLPAPGGSRNLGAMILRGECNLTLPHVRQLAAHFNVSAEVFI